MKRREFITRFAGLVSCTVISPYLNSGLKFIGRYDDSRFKSMIREGEWLKNESFYLLNDAYVNAPWVTLQNCKLVFADKTKGLIMDGDNGSLILDSGVIEYPIEIRGDGCSLMPLGEWNSSQIPSLSIDSYSDHPPETHVRSLTSKLP